MWGCKIHYNRGYYNNGKGGGIHEIPSLQLHRGGHIVEPYVSL